MALNFNSICRLCMGKKGTFLSLFNDKKGQMVSAKIMNFVPVIKVISGDGLPAQVCRQCVRLVNTSYKFKQQCENSDTTLRQYLTNQTYQENNDEIIHSVFQPDSNEEKWKFDTVKDEISVDDAMLNNSPDRNESDDEYSVKRESDGYVEHRDWEKLDASAPTKKNKETEENTKKINKPNISSRKRLKGKKVQKNWSSYKKVKNDSHIKNEISNPDESENFDNVTDTSRTDDTLTDIKVESFELKIKHPRMKEKKTFLCHHCGKNFARKQHVLLHLRTHTGEKPFACKVCGESFGMSSNLNKHMRIHTGERPFLCTMCGKCFGRSDTLTKHMRCHTGEKPFHCNVCGNNFGRSSTLINHMRTHLGEKPYLCTECGRRFVQSYDLTKHMRSHTGEKPYRCTTCRMSFGQKNSLNKHMRSHTGEISFPPMDFQRSLPYVHYGPAITDMPMERSAVFIGGVSQFQ